MKGKVISQRVVQEALRNFVVAELYTDRATALDNENARLQKERFASVALPLYVTLGPDGKERSRLENTATLEQFLDFLKKGQSPPARGD
jgi:hypothetical protein